MKKCNLCGKNDIEESDNACECGASICGIALGLAIIQLRELGAYTQASDGAVVDIFMSRAKKKLLDEYEKGVRSR